MKNKAVFLDRDGVINVDILTYTWKKEDFKILDGVFDSCRKFAEAGFQLIVITNQGGIDRGMYTHADVADLHQHMIRLFREEGIEILDIYYCPHHDSVGKCLCRKPGSLLVEKAAARFNIDTAQSWFIGDRERDIDAGKGAGVINGILVDVNDDMRKVLPKMGL